jgi:hypothetical protein
MNKYDLGLAKNYKHWIHLKNENPVNRKQFKIPEAHHNFIEQTLEAWLKLGVVRKSDSLYYKDKDSRSYKTSGSLTRTDTSTNTP